MEEKERRGGREEAHLREELYGDSVQCLLGPRSEPVDGYIVDESGEVPAARL